MRLDHVSYVASHDQISDVVNRIGSQIGTAFVDGGIHPKFGTRNFTAPLLNGQYIEVVCPLDHPATDANARQNRANILKLPLMIKDIASAFKAAQQLVEAAKTDAVADTEKKDEDEISKLKEAWGATGSKMASGGSKAVKELEKEQKSRSTRMVRDYLDRALLDLATLYRDVLLLQSNSTDSLINQDLIEQINQMAISTNQAETLSKIESILKARNNLAKNAAPLLLTEALFMAWARIH